MIHQPIAPIVRRATVVLVVAAVTTACTNRTTVAKPSIAFTEVPEAAEGGEQRVAAIAGRVSGALPNQRVVLFARSGAWWVQPVVANPFTAVGADGSWKNTTHLGMEYAALLVDSTYQPPPTTESLPAAVARSSRSLLRRAGAPTPHGRSRC
jgi:hypothetical protein